MIVPKVKTQKKKLTWQAQKSSFTRDRIILATLTSIVEVGYARTTMASIAKMAGLSQGSMQYHFQTKIDVIKAAVGYLHIKRLTDHQNDLSNIPDSVDPMDYSVDVYWKHLNEPHFLAYQELVIAARTDSELAAVLRPAYKTFERMWRQHSLDQMPQWRQAQDRFDLLSNVGQYLMEGMALGVMNEQLGQDEVKVMLDYTKQVLRELLSRDNTAGQAAEKTAGK